ncbi:c-type cytochrome biogenesis protein CcmI/CycH [Aquifex sp.]
MKKILFLLLFTLLACQDIPQKYKTPEGQKILEKYKKQFVKGVVELDPKLKEQVPEGNKFLIISVRKVQSQSPRPVAVLRVENPEFPYRFVIRGKHKINPEEFIEGELLIMARLSKDPTAGFKDGDLYGVANAKAGDEDVRIVINQVFKSEQKESENKNP